MLLINIFAGLGLLGFLSAVLMAVTVVGVCRYGDRYRHFFERLKALGALATIKEMSRVYFGLLNKFLGRRVGFRQPGVLNQSKYIGPYIEHLTLLYWFVATILVLSFRPVDPFGEEVNSLLQAAAFITLLTINVVSDAISLLWTKRCIALLAVPRTPITLKKLFVVLAQDLAVAVILMVFVQFISNGLYAIQIGRPSEVFKHMFDVNTAFKLYAPIDPRFSHFQFPGQLVITCTTYIPSLLFYVTCLIILALMPFYKLLFWLFSVFNVETDNDTEGQLRSCSQLSFISSLVGVGAFAMASCGVVVGSWALMRPS